MLRILRVDLNKATSTAKTIVGATVVHGFDVKLAES